MTKMYQYHSNNRDQLRHKMQRHGFATGKDGYIRLYQIWLGMRNRCDNPKSKCYRSYGGRGIRICDEWQNYPAFREWALVNGYQENLTIDRINTGGDYSPSNCRFLPIAENQKRRTMNHYIICEGRAYTLTSLTKFLGARRTALHNRLRKKGMAATLEYAEKKYGKKLRLTTLHEIESQGIELV